MLSPRTERHHDNCAVVLWAVVKSLRGKQRIAVRQPTRQVVFRSHSCFVSSHLIRYSLGCFFGVMALVNDIADLLAVHNEVNAIGGQCQKGVMGVVQLKERQREQHSSLCCKNVWNATFGFTNLQLFSSSQVQRWPPFPSGQSLRYCASWLTCRWRWAVPNYSRWWNHRFSLLCSRCTKRETHRCTSVHWWKPNNVALFHFHYLSFSSFLSGVWSTVSLRAFPFRHSMARLSPTLPTTSSMPSLSSATVEVVPGFIRGTTET